jgi:hypothetical protein
VNNLVARGSADLDANPRAFHRQLVFHDKCRQIRLRGICILFYDIQVYLD